MGDLGIRLTAVGGIRRAVGDQLRRRAAGQRGPDRPDHHQDRRHRRAARCCCSASERCARRSRPARSPHRDSSAALVAGLFAFGGWHMVTYAAEETRDPERTIPRALMFGTAVVVVVYLAAATAPTCSSCRSIACSRRRASRSMRRRQPPAPARRRRSPCWSSYRRSARRAASFSPVRASTTRWRRIDCCSRGWARCIRSFARRISRSSRRASWSSVLVLTGTYGTIVSRVIYTEWIFFAALALGTMALRRQRALFAGVPGVGVSDRAERCSR